MLNRLLAPVLVGCLILSAISCAVLSLQWFFTVGEAQKLQGLAFRINSTLNAAQALVNDSVEYSRQNPAIDPILYQFNFKAPPGGTNAPEPAPAKPSRKP